MLPKALLHSLSGLKGFDQKAFEEVHASGSQVTSIRLNQFKNASIDSEWAVPGEVPWCPYGRYLSVRPSFTLDPLLHAGAYYVQEASSMFLWHVLKETIGADTQKKVLDLCAAPGGKSTLLANYFTDGLVVANEVIRQRVSTLVENITKWGSDHVIITNNDPSHFQSLPGYFDVMMIDAPCSGSGLFRRDRTAIDEWSESNVELCSQRQQRILADALPALKEDGILIYSTCSYSPEEDEEIADWLVTQMQMETTQLPVPHEWGIIETRSAVKGAFGYRFYPNRVKGEGFFIAAFQKKASHNETRLKELAISVASKQELQQLTAFIELPAEFIVFKPAESLRAIKSQHLPDLRQLAKCLYIKKAGVEIGTIKGKDMVPSHELALGSIPLLHMPSISLNKENSLQYLRRKETVMEASNGWNLVKYEGLPLGWVKVLPNRINNYYPAEWRILKE